MEYSIWQPLGDTGRGGVKIFFRIWSCNISLERKFDADSILNRNLGLKISRSQATSFSRGCRTGL